MFRFQKTDTEVTGEMLSSKDKDTLLLCISAGMLPEILQRGDVELEVVKRREQGSSLYLDKETGELVSYAEMKAQGGLEKAPAELGFSFLAYNFRRVVNLLGVNGIMEMIMV